MPYSYCSTIHSYKKGLGHLTLWCANSSSRETKNKQNMPTYIKRLCFSNKDMTKGPRGLAHQRMHTGPNLISPQTLKASLHSRLILPFSHHTQLHTYNLPLFILHSALFPQSLCFKKHPFHTYDFVSIPKISKTMVTHSHGHPIIHP